MMEKKATIERFYDYLDRCAMRFYTYDKTPYLNGLSMAISYLLDDAFEKDVDAEVLVDLESFKQDITGIDFEKETIRKAIQLSLLKGFKDLNITNSMLTPDSIGMFIGYLMKKLFGSTDDLSVYDPLVGTGNLLATINNHYHEGLRYIGTDVDPLLCSLARNVLDALEINAQIYHQDNRDFAGGPFDVVVTDFPVEKKDRKHAYFPYEVILKHKDNLKDYGFFIALIENDFFDQKEAGNFKKTLQESMHLFGLIKLDEGLFKAHPKSILILQKKGHEQEKIDTFLLADLPPFTDKERFNGALEKIEDWFNDRKVD